MDWLKEWFESRRMRRKEHKNERRIKYLTRRASEIFTLEEYDGRMWLFCNDTGVLPCSHLGLKTEDEMLKFVNDIRKLYVETESEYD